MLEELNNFPLSAEWLSEADQTKTQLCEPLPIQVASQAPPGILGLIQVLRSGKHETHNIFASALAYCASQSLPVQGDKQNDLAIADFSSALRREWGVHGQMPLASKLQELWDSLSTDAELGKVLQFASENLGTTDPAHDIHHVLRVALWGLQIAHEAVNPKHLIASAILHDVVNLPKNHPHARSASKMSSDLSRAFLTKIAFASEAQIDEICSAIEEHSYSRGMIPSSNLSRALQDADRLDAMGSTGIVRLFVVGAQLGADPFDPHDPWALRRSLDDKKFTIDHFFTKIFHLADTMCTPKGRAEAILRTATMRHFIDSLRQVISPLNDLTSLPGEN